MTKETLASKWEALSLEMSTLEHPTDLQPAQLLQLQKQMFFLGASSMARLMYDAITKTKDGPERAKKLLGLVEEIKAFMESVKC